MRSRDYKDPQCVAYGVDSYNQTAMEEVQPNIKVNGGGDSLPKVAYAVTSKGNGDAFINSDTHTSLSVGGGEPGQGYPCVMQEVYENHSQDCRYRELGEVCQPVSATFGMGGNNQPLVKEVFDASRRHSYEPFGDVSETVQAAYGTGGNNTPMVKEDTVVRRLTPLECERLQGFPDNWTDIGDWTDSKGKLHKAADSPRYKALGNSIAIPFWFYLLRRIAAQYERPATLGSLFDGIGGFPLCWERCNGKGTAIWASEIEEFPIAVTKIRFPK